MKVAIEAYISVMIICICALLCVCLISSDLKVANARDAYTTYVLQLQDSNFAGSVIAACVSDAESRGYTLNVETYDTGDGNMSATIELLYEYKIAVIGYTTDRVIRGYAS